MSVPLIAQKLSSQKSPEYQKSLTWHGKKINLVKGSVCKDVFGILPGAIYSLNGKKVVIVGMDSSENLYIKDSHKCRGQAHLLTDPNQLMILRSRALVQVDGTLKRKRGDYTEEANRIVCKNCELPQGDNDVIFQLKDGQVEGHRVFFMKCSPYFQQLLSGYFKENQLKQVPMLEYTVEEFKFVKDFLYSTSKAKITPRNILWVAHLADSLCLDELKQCCIDFIPYVLMPSTILSYVQAVGEVDFFLSPKIFDVFSASIEDIMKEDQETILQLTKKQILYILQKCPQATLKQQLFNFLITWAFHKDVEIDSQMMAELFSFFFQEMAVPDFYVTALCEKLKEKDTPSHKITILTKDSASETLNFVYAQVLFVLKRSEEAKVQYEAVIKYNPEHVQALQKLAQSALYLNKFSEAEHLARQAYKTDCGSKTAIYLLAEACRRQDNLVEAESLFQQLSEDKEDKNVYLRSCAIRGLADIALRLHRNRIKAKEHIIVALAGGKYDTITIQVLEDISRAFQHSDSSLVLLLAKAFVMQGRFEDAKSRLKDILNISPNQCHALIYLGTVLKQEGNYKEAKETFMKVLQGSPKQVVLLKNGC